ncbi:MAG: YggS family pyridoxal phosphate-dependent enzyme [Saprospiraceae bacterium]|nr:YggS family pyridoxal phosphate-dependent enzyme [Saprospiraceae bacterium]
MEKVQALRQYLDTHRVKLVAVSKTKSLAEIRQVYANGQRIFGENRARELAEKQPGLPGDIEWHMIGHLQTNKVKYIAPFVAMIQSVDSLKLLDRIELDAGRAGRTIDVLLQVKIAREESKYGFELDTLPERIGQLTGGRRHVNVRGLMGMASFVDDEDVIRSEFRALKQLFDTLRSDHLARKQDFDTLSMGMSGDYRIAVEEGSTMVRIGSLIFGPRT